MHLPTATKTHRIFTPKHPAALRGEQRRRRHWAASASLISAVILVCGCTSEPPPAEEGAVVMQLSEDGSSEKLTLNAKESALSRIDLDNGAERALVALRFNRNENEYLDVRLEYQRFTMVDTRTELRDDGNWTPDNSRSDVALQWVDESFPPYADHEWRGTINVPDSFHAWTAGSFDLYADDGATLVGDFLVHRDYERDTDD